MPSESPRTLAVVLAMHRSGSSLVVNILAELGMSLGPFALLPADQHNIHGYFESLPFCELDRLVLQEIWGFTGDMPGTPEQLHRLCDAQGQWPSQADVERLPVEHGVTALRGLVDSGAISGFKDPRLPLAWPFWQRVLAAFPQVRVIPVLVMRSPHEIAMSLFVRSMGAVDYSEALEMVAVYLKRMKAIAERFGPQRVVVRFGTVHFQQDMRDAAEAIGLPWRPDAVARLLRPGSIHHRSARLRHAAQALFDEISGIESTPPGDRDMEVIQEDASVREKLLRETRVLARIAATEGGRLVSLLQQRLNDANSKLSLAQARIKELEAPSTGRRADDPL